jgi:hypothetical protein
LVDVNLLQSLSYVAAALGVCVASFYYAMNLRETTRNRRVTLTTSLLQNFTSEEGSKRWMEIMQMEWKDMEDFDRKYDSSVNIDNYAKRNAIFNTMDVLGYQYRKGMIDAGTLWSICNNGIPSTWAKFKPIIDANRRRGWYSQNQYENWEYLAHEMARVISERDSDFKGAGYFKSDEYQDAFGNGKSTAPIA